MPTSYDPEGGGFRGPRNPHSDDFFLFLERFAAGDPDDDFDRDGDHDAEDFFAFLDAFTIL